MDVEESTQLRSSTDTTLVNILDSLTLITLLILCFISLLGKSSFRKKRLLLFFQMILNIGNVMSQGI